MISFLIEPLYLLVVVLVVVVIHGCSMNIHKT
jgi:hypothetical protein